MKNVVFLFNPLIPSSSIGPYLAPHLLSTILRKKGFNVINRDLNRDFVNDICDLQYVRRIKIEIEKYLAESKNLDKERADKITSSLRHTEMLIDHLENNKPIQFSEKVFLGNSIGDFFVGHLKTVKDYVKNGLNTIDPIKELFYKLLDQLDVEGKTVCISCAFGDQLPFSLEAARYLRSKTKNIKIILGGAQVSLLPQEAIDDIRDLKLFNVFFSGFAEEKISELIDHCPIDFFETVTYGSVATSKMLDAIPYTDFDEMEKYSNQRIPVLVNKGCYWGKCSFCDYILMGDLGGFRYISRNVDIVYDEIKKVREKYPDSYVNLISDAVPPKFYKELCIKANEENFELRTGSYMINNKNLTEDFFIEASKARIGIIVFGTESTNDRILGLMQKQGRREDILKNFDLARKYRIPIKVNLIPNYPSTTFQEALQTYQDIWQYDDIITSLSVFKFYLSANTQMDRTPDEYELEVNKDIPYLKSQNNGFHSRDFKAKMGMTALEEKKIYDLFNDLSFNISLNYSKHVFYKSLKENSNRKLRLKNEIQILNKDGRYFFHSFSRGRVHSIPSNDIPLINDLKEKKKTIDDVCTLLGDKAQKWLEHYFALELLEFEQAS